MCVFISEENLIKQIANNVKVNMSTKWEGWDAKKAIDLIDNDDGDPTICNCCSGTRNTHVWWKIDLGSNYPIKSIIFIGRSDSK